MVQRLRWAVGGGNVMSCAAHVKTAVEKNTTGHGERKQYGLLKNHRAVWEEIDS